MQNSSTKRIYNFQAGFHSVQSAECVNKGRKDFFFSSLAVKYLIKREGVDPLFISYLNFSLAKQNSLLKFITWLPLKL